jgi:cyclic dehypoxanthinyl futalosine synthase
MGITRQQALDCFASDDLIGIGMEADAVRRDLHPENVVSYTIGRHIDSEINQACANARRSVAIGATGLLLPELLPQQANLEDCETLLRGLKESFPSIQVHGLSATQVLKLAAASQFSLSDTMARLRDAGLDAISGSEVILSDEFRKHAAPDRCTTTDWINVHRTAHQLGLPTEAILIFGVGETIAQRVDHLELLRSLQEETGGFTAFTPITAQAGAALIPLDVAEPTAVEYLTTLAVSRLYLDNIPHLQGSWATQGLKVLQMSLRFGANDVGFALLNDHISKPGSATEEELRRVIREAGFRPAQRDILYRKMFLD